MAEYIIEKAYEQWATFCSQNGKIVDKEQPNLIPPLSSGNLPIYTDKFSLCLSEVFNNFTLASGTTWDIQPKLGFYTHGLKVTVGGVNIIANTSP